MASTAGLKITIGADVSQAVKSLGTLESELKQLKLELSVATAPETIVRLNREIKNLDSTIKNAKSAENIAALNTSLNKVAPGANQAGQALTNLGRVAQDAPFGFIGIQNNINPLLESFQQLQKQTGSTAAAFKALGSSLLGAGGIGLAISVVTSLITTAVQKYGSLANAIDEVFGLTTNLAKANRELTKSFAESEGNVAGEIANIKSLVAIAQDKSLSDSVRTEALNKLNKEYDAYLPKLTLETINTDKAKAATDGLTESLIRQAKIKGAQDLISKATAAQLELAVGSVRDQASIIDNVLAGIKSLGSAGQNFNANLVAAGAERGIKSFDKLQETIDVYTKALNNLNKEEAKAGTLFADDIDKKEKRIKSETDFLGKQLSLLEKIAAIQQKAVDVPVINKPIIGFEVDGLTDKEIEELTGARKIEQALREVEALMKTSEKIYSLKIEKIDLDVKKKIISLDEAKALKKDAQDELEKVFTLQALVLEGTVRVKPTVTVERANLDTGAIQSKIARETGLDKKIAIPIEFDINVKFLGEEMARKLQETQRKIAEFKEFLISNISTGVSDSFALLGESFGEAISGANIGEVIAKAAQGFLSIIGNVLTEVGKQIIITSKLVIALKAALAKSFQNPAASLIVGVALVAAGSALKNIKFNVPKMQYGGILTSPRTVMAGEAGPEAIIPLDRLGSMIGGSATNINLTGRLAMNKRELFLELQRVGESNVRVNR